MTTHSDRRVITFYSFKGGVGRTMALANVAHRLAVRHGLNVIAVDWDLEAPGLPTFFSLPKKTLAKSRGLLDYCEAWEAAYANNAESPPDPLSYLVPVQTHSKAETKSKDEAKGILRLMSAGRQDAHYDARLGRFDWKRFYERSAGAGAVEHLRNTLAANADVVLIDSRTGLTDPGGICTIQIPDAVVLMTAPNKQSLEGIERVAQSIAQASREQRAGKELARVFLCMSRIPIVEETHLARQWFIKHQAWFEAGVAAKLWRREEHPQGLETHVIPHRALYGFDESIVGPAVDTLAREPLAKAYDDLTYELLKWLWESISVDSTIDTKERALAVARSDRKVARAEKRGDPVALCIALYQHATNLLGMGRNTESLNMLERAVALGEGVLDKSLLVAMKLARGRAFFRAQRYQEAAEILDATLREEGNFSEPIDRNISRAYLGAAYIYLDEENKGAELMLDAIWHLRANGAVASATDFMAMLHYAQMSQAKAKELSELVGQTVAGLRSLVNRARVSGNISIEINLLRDILKVAEKYPLVIPDASKLRARLAQLEATPAKPAPRSPAKPKRSRAK